MTNTQLISLVTPREYKLIFRFHTVPNAVLDEFRLLQQLKMGNLEIDLNSSKDNIFSGLKNSEG